jgi:hypothetical protein
MFDVTRFGPFVVLKNFSPLISSLSYVLTRVELNRKKKSAATVTFQFSFQPPLFVRSGNRLLYGNFKCQVI